ncbi:hypothetical protein BDV27DRAFT_14654 [Aspergillus caelatus]|uniref:Secreted protein n=1 Tax=Aspergillus caelatus TaxID=61420 RepID=A0A5N6ZZ04_9EURO|nr:uncharacterized protein BDV27DRAFT_14654 [Aspergillus caelatus]KAE8362831.1 hypothetical protein BDV27DRAFT_14654 [Aspergillus caelatus]
MHLSVSLLFSLSHSTSLSFSLYLICSFLHADPNINGFLPPQVIHRNPPNIIYEKKNTSQTSPTFLLFFFFSHMEENRKEE